MTANPVDTEDSGNRQVCPRVRLRPVRRRSFDKMFDARAVGRAAVVDDCFWAKASARHNVCDNYDGRRAAFPSAGRRAGGGSRGREKSPTSGVDAQMRPIPPPTAGTLSAPTYKPSRIFARRARGERGTQRSHLAPGANRRDFCGVARALSASPTANPVGAEERGSAPVSFTRSSGVDARAEVLAASELRLLADTSLELADRYERDAEFMEDEEGRQIALALSRWRRCRGRYFLELSAEAERIEATHVDWARTCVGRP